jgi:hypothetical protein
MTIPKYIKEKFIEKYAISGEHGEPIINRYPALVIWKFIVKVYQEAFEAGKKEGFDYGDYHYGPTNITWSGGSPKGNRGT